MRTGILAKQVRQVLSNKRLRGALFYKWPFGLRFETGGDWACRPLFMYQAMYRSKTLLEHVFQDSDRVIVSLVCYAKRKTKNPCRQLEECGFVLPSEHELHDQIDKTMPGHAYRILFSAKITSAKVHAILWAINSNRIGIKPTAPVRAYFIDSTKRIIAHPYHERGMDIVAHSKDALTSCYTNFNEWILEYDRKRIDAVFAQRRHGPN